MKDKNIAIILAAGKGSRMNSSIPKPLQEVAGRSILDHILYNIKSAGFDETIVVINKDHLNFFEYLNASDENIKISFQENQLGTGDAVKSGLIGHDLSEVNNVLVVLATPLYSQKKH